MELSDRSVRALQNAYALQRDNVEQSKGRVNKAQQALDAARHTLYGRQLELTELADDLERLGIEPPPLSPSFNFGTITDQSDQFTVNHGFLDFHHMRPIGESEPDPDLDDDYEDRPWDD